MRVQPPEKSECSSPLRPLDTVAQHTLESKGLHTATLAQAGRLWERSVSDRRRGANRSAIPSIFYSDVSRRSFFSTLPSAFFGSSSRITTSFGTL